MKKETKPSHNILWAIVCLYLIPSFILCLYSINFSTLDQSWGILSLGLLLGTAGSILMFILLRKWEEALPKIVEIPVEAPPVYLEKSDTEELKKFRDEAERFSAYKSAVEEELKKKEALMNEFQETITRQREILKNRQEQVTELEGKIQDLNGEVKTLLNEVKITETTPDISSGMHLKETVSVYQVTPPPSIVTSPAEANLQLKRCMDIAGKITGANHFEAANSRFKEWHIDNYALDLRRLFDHLRGESSCTIFVFAQKDNRLLFVNNQAKHMLGWIPEKFIQNFPEIIGESLQDWNRGISRLSSQPETTMQLTLKNKVSQPVAVSCHLGMISSGLFRNHIIGVMYASTAYAI